MEKTRVLYVSQEISPYLKGGHFSKLSRELPQAMQEKGREIRIFMPRYGNINERRHQLHEVIRLSGMNLIIDDMDHPLIIKVASIPAARMQVYFIDNEEYFKRKAALEDDKGKLFKDNDERAIFFCRGVLETVKKLGWSPDIVHCHGWMTAPMGLLIKKVYKDDPIFAQSKVVYSTYSEGFEGTLDQRFVEKLDHEAINAEDKEIVNEPSFDHVNKLGIQHADGVIAGDEQVDAGVLDFAKTHTPHVLEYQSEQEYAEAYSKLYDEILAADSVLAE